MWRKRSPRRTSCDRLTQPSVLVPVQTRSSSTSPDFLPCCRNNCHRALVPFSDTEDSFVKKMRMCLSDDGMFGEWGHFPPSGHVWKSTKNTIKKRKKSCSLQIETFKKTKKSAFTEYSDSILCKLTVNKAFSRLPHSHLTLHYFSLIPPSHSILFLPFFPPKLTVSRWLLCCRIQRDTRV